MAMAVADSPVGPFEYVGRVRYPESEKPAGWRDGKDGLDDGDMAFFGGRAVLSRRGITLKEYPYDPALLLHDGRLFLYFGLMNCYVVELDMADMRTVVTNATGGYATQIFRGGLLGLARDALTKSRDGRPLRQRSLDPGDRRHVRAELLRRRAAAGSTACTTRSRTGRRARSRRAARWCPSATRASTARSAPTDHVGNTHGGMFAVGDQWYQIYHRHTKSGRSACAVPLTRTADGGFEHAEHTSMGFSPTPLDAFYRWPAYMACHLTDGKGVSGKAAPVIVQRDYDNPEGELPVVSRLQAGDVVGYQVLRLRRGSRCLVPDVSIEVNPASRGRVDVVLDDPLSGRHGGDHRHRRADRHLGFVHRADALGERGSRRLPGRPASGQGARRPLVPRVRPRRLTRRGRRAWRSHAQRR